MFRKAAILLLPILLLNARPAAAQAPNPSFNLVNKTSQPIKELHLSPAGRDTFGTKNWLAGPAAPGAKTPVRLPVTGDCIFDLEAIYADNTKQAMKAINICKTDDVAFAGGKAANDPSFRLINRGTKPVAELYATPAGKTRGANVLTTPLAPGADAAIKLDKGGCSYDLHVVFADKTAKDRKATDLCKVTELPVS